MLFLGIDIDKNNHVASMMDETGKVVFKAFSFPNTSDGGEALFVKLCSFSRNPSDFEIGLEATTGLPFTLSSLTRGSFSMSSIPFRQMDGAEERKSVNARMIALTLS